jgi:hypothetical protein
MRSLVDPSLLPWTLTVLPGVAAYLFLARRRALDLLETAFLLAVSSVALVAFGVTSLHGYGWTLFVVLPFLLGLGAVLLQARNAPERTFGRFFGVASLALGLTCVGLLLLAVEGAICLVMAAPLSLALVLLGVSLGNALRPRAGEGLSTIAGFLLLLAVAPLAMGAESAVPRRPPVYEVSTSLVIQAPPEVVWKHVVALPKIHDPEEWIFRAGVAYPVQTEIDGAGVGASRRCILSTGPMPETVEVWDEPRLLRFAVLRTPPSMRELSPWGEIYPPHLEGFYESRRGQFRLEPLPGGRTRVVGTSWYQHGLYPATYWRLWSDWVVHQVHRRVLNSVRRISEEEWADLRRAGGHAL